MHGIEASPEGFQEGNHEDPLAHLQGVAGSSEGKSGARHPLFDEYRPRYPVQPPPTRSSPPSRTPSESGEESHKLFGGSDMEVPPPYPPPPVPRKPNATDFLSPFAATQHRTDRLSTVVRVLSAVSIPRSSSNFRTSLFEGHPTFPANLDKDVFDFTDIHETRQVFGIGLKITDAAPYQVVSCPNLKDMSGASLEHDVEAGDELLSIDARPLREVGDRAALILGPRDSSVALKLRRKNGTEYMISAMRHIFIDERVHSEKAIALRPELRGCVLAADPGIVDSLNAMRDVLVNQKGEYCDLLADEDVAASSKDGRLGFEVMAHDLSLRRTVSRVSRGGPACIAGLMVGDEVMEVDGTEVLLNGANLGSLLSGQAGSVSVLAVRRGGEILELRIQRMGKGKEKQAEALVAAIDDLAVTISERLAVCVSSMSSNGTFSPKGFLGGLIARKTSDPAMTELKERVEQARGLAHVLVGEVIQRDTAAARRVRLVQASLCKSVLDAFVCLHKTLDPLHKSPSGVHKSPLVGTAVSGKAPSALAGAVAVQADVIISRSGSAPETPEKPAGSNNLLVELATVRSASKQQKLETVRQENARLQEKVRELENRLRPYGVLCAKARSEVVELIELLSGLDFDLGEFAGGDVSGDWDASEYAAAEWAVTHSLPTYREGTLDILSEAAEVEDEDRSWSMWRWPNARRAGTGGKVEVDRAVGKLAEAGANLAAEAGRLRVESEGQREELERAVAEREVWKVQCHRLLRVDEGRAVAMGDLQREVSRLNEEAKGHEVSKAALGDRAGQLNDLKIVVEKLREDLRAKTTEGEALMVEIEFAKRDAERHGKRSGELGRIGEELEKEVEGLNESLGIQKAGAEALAARCSAEFAALQQKLEDADQEVAIQKEERGKTLACNGELVERVASLETERNIFKGEAERLSVRNAELNLELFRHGPGKDQADALRSEVGKLKEQVGELGGQIQMMQGHENEACRLRKENEVLRRGLEEHRGEAEKHRREWADLETRLELSEQRACVYKHDAEHDEEVREGLEMDVARLRGEVDALERRSAEVGGQAAAWEETCGALKAKVARLQSENAKVVRDLARRDAGMKEACDQLEMEVIRLEAWLGGSQGAVDEARRAEEEVASLEAKNAELCAMLERAHAVSEGSSRDAVEELGGGREQSRALKRQLAEASANASEPKTEAAVLEGEHSRLREEASRLKEAMQRMTRDHDVLRVSLAEADSKLAEYRHASEEETGGLRSENARLQTAICGSATQSAETEQGGGGAADREALEAEKAQLLVGVEAERRLHEGAVATNNAQASKVGGLVEGLRRCTVHQHETMAEGESAQRENHMLLRKIEEAAMEIQNLNHQLRQGVRRGGEQCDGAERTMWWMHVNIASAVMMFLIILGMLIAGPVHKVVVGCGGRYVFPRVM